MNTELSVGARAAMHAALGDPVRLAIVDALMLGDAAPTELGHQLGIGSNLLAHHLKVLDRCGIVRRLRSEGDHRRSYVTLVTAALDAMAATVTRTVPRVVFVCSRNSARSQLATAIWSGTSHIPATSAGTRPAQHVHPGAVDAANRHGLTMRPVKPRRVADIALPTDVVVAVCDRAHEELGDLPRLHWSVPDPIRIGTDDAFDDVVGQLDVRITRLASMATPPTGES